MDERKQCPVCRRYVSVTAGGSLRMHRAATGPAKCEASGVLPATARDIAAKSKPCRPMLGGETGDDVADGCTCGGKMWCLACQEWQYPTTATTCWMCTADDARGPA